MALVRTVHCISRETGSQWEGSKQGLKDAIGVLKDDFDPGILAAATGDWRRSPGDLWPSLRGKEALQPENQGCQQLPEFKSLSRAPVPRFWSRGAQPNSPPAPPAPQGITESPACKMSGPPLLDYINAKMY